MPPALVCDQCGAEHRFVGALPEACPSCGVLTIWRTPTDRPWTLTLNDKRLLKGLRIAAE